MVNAETEQQVDARSRLNPACLLLYGQDGEVASHVQASQLEPLAKLLRKAVGFTNQDVQVGSFLTFASAIMPSNSIAEAVLWLLHRACIRGLILAAVLMAGP